MSAAHVLKDLLKAAHASAPGQRLRGLVAPPAGVTVLTYHRVLDGSEPFDGLPLDAFRAQMRWLARHCDALSADEFVHTRPSGRSRGRRRVLITFDDGYRSHHTLAYAVLQELRLPHVVFLATAFMDHGGMIWTDELGLVLRRSPCGALRLPWSGDTLPLRDDTDRHAATRALKRQLKALPDAERRQRLDALWQALRLHPRDAADDRQMLNWHEVRAMREFATPGGHTHTHPVMSRLPHDAAALEIRLCRDRIEAETGQAPALFAYPNGRRADFDAGTPQQLAAHGFSAAFTTERGVWQDGMDPWRVPRQPTAARGLGDFAWLVAGG